MAERPHHEQRSAGAAGAEPHHVPPPAQGELAGWYRMAGVGTEFIAAIGVFGALGWFLDRWLGSGPWLLITGCGLGFAVGLWLMYKAARNTFR
jgi:ATP synthase protein I